MLAQQSSKSSLNINNNNNICNKGQLHHHDARNHQQHTQRQPTSSSHIIIYARTGALRAVCASTSFSVMRVVCNRRRASISPNSADLGDRALRLAWQTCLPLHLSAVYLRSAKGPSGYAARHPWSSCATPSDLGHGCVAKGCQQCDRTRSPRIARTQTTRNSMASAHPCSFRSWQNVELAKPTPCQAVGRPHLVYLGQASKLLGLSGELGSFFAHTGYPPPTNSSSVNCARTPCSTFALLLNLSLETWLRELPTSAEWLWASEDSRRRYVQLSAQAQRYRSHTEPVLVSEKSWPTHHKS